jgi:hypothetical protein
VLASRKAPSGGWPSIVRHSFAGVAVRSTRNRSPRHPRRRGWHERRTPVPPQEILGPCRLLRPAVRDLATADNDSRIRTARAGQVVDPDAGLDGVTANRCTVAGAENFSWFGMCSAVRCRTWGAFGSEAPTCR